GQAAGVPIADAERAELQSAGHENRHRTAPLPAAHLGAAGADAELSERIVSPAVRRAISGDAARGHDPGADADEREAAGHRGGCPCARERPIAEPTVRVVPPAIGDAARLDGAGLVPPSAQRCETAPAGDGEWCRAAGSARVAALLLAGVAGTELPEIIQAPAVRGTGRREAAAVHRSDADGGQAQIRGHLRRREAACLCGIATLAVRAVAPA